jgi:hypothetical protein
LSTFPAVPIMTDFMTCQYSLAIPPAIATEN